MTEREQHNKKYIMEEGNKQSYRREQREQSLSESVQVDGKLIPERAG